VGLVEGDPLVEVGAEAQACGLALPSARKLDRRERRVLDLDPTLLAGRNNQ
jgi:hypothetical protein